MKNYNIAVVGATGMVGRTILRVLEERNFPVNNLYLFSSSKSAGTSVEFSGKTYTVEKLNESSFNRDIHIALFAAGGSISSKYAPIAVSKGVIVIDNSSAFRMNEEVPLVVPEVNETDIYNHKGIIANPNCSTIQAVVALKPLHDKYNIKRIVFSTYQAVSGSGVKGISDLENGLSGKPNTFYPHPIVNNCLPHIDIFTDNGYSKEELKMIQETKKILNDYGLKITATTVRVPVTNCHSESVNVEFYKDFDLMELKDLLKNSPGIVLIDNPANNEYPLASLANGKDHVFVGRVRRDESVDSGINMWIVADNIRKGAATNAVQIAESLIKSL
ncbi:MAG: aspartate-semialdehyde dehydrogenase [Clostridiales bacterium]|nr:aspartate-semialdehyde dehydrogenase [Clostridiales bacterium]